MPMEEPLDVLPVAAVTQIAILNNANSEDYLKDDQAIA
jgi:hypothetical protein